MEIVPIKKKLISSTMWFISLLFLVTFAVITIVNISMVRRNQRDVAESIEQILIHEGERLSKNPALPAMIEDHSFTSVNDLITNTLENDPNYRLGIFVDTGEVIWGAWEKRSALHSPGKRALVSDSILSWMLARKDFSYRKREHNGEMVYDFASPVMIDNQVRGFLLFSVSTKEVLESISIMYEAGRRTLILYGILLVVLTAAALTVAFSFISRFSSQITKPIERLIESVGYILSGDYCKSIPIETNDEIALLSMEFDQMRQSIKVATEKLYRANSELEVKRVSLEELNETLEQKVDQRTKELQRSLEELKIAQDHLVESEKMASLGGLVAGVAHEVNTPVGIGVTAASHMAKEAKEFAEKYRSGTLSRHDFESYVSDSLESATILLNNMQRAAALIQSFKQVAVDQTVEEVRKFELGAYIAELLVSLRPKYKKTSHTVSVVCSEDFFVNTYPGPISQVVTNLVNNSLLHGFEGMENGEITIEVELLGDEAYILYRDSGRGIPKAHIDKIFDPFFTTKRGAGGTGLGMHILYNLITQTLKGRIICHDTEQQGASFTICFPSNINDVEI